MYNVLENGGWLMYVDGAEAINSTERIYSAIIFKVSKQFKQ